jgi:hypothetical protein
MSNKTAPAIDLKKLNEEIKARKTELHGVDERTNQPLTNKRDSFLSEFMRSYKTGVETKAIQTIKEVENKAIARTNQKFNRNEKPKFGSGNFSNNNGSTFGLDIASNSNNSSGRIPLNEMDDDYNPREEQLFAELKKHQSQGAMTLAEQMKLYEMENDSKFNKQKSQQPSLLNEDSIKGVIDRYLVENYNLLVEDSIKNVMLETYAMSRIKDVIMENKGLIKSIVIEVIKEIQQKNKKD